MMLACGVCGQASPRGILLARLSKSCGQTGLFRFVHMTAESTCRFRTRLFSGRFSRRVDQASFVQPSIRFLSVEPEPRYLSDLSLSSQSTITAFFSGSRVGTRFERGYEITLSLHAFLVVFKPPTRLDNRNLIVDVSGYRDSTPFHFVSTRLPPSQCVSPRPPSLFFFYLCLDSPFSFAIFPTRWIAPLGCG